MKKSIRHSYIVFISLLFISLFSGCENFLSGQAVAADLQDAVEYANAAKHTIRVRADENTGTILSNRENVLKVSDDLEAAFQLAKGYKFLRWAAVNVDDNSISMADYVDIKNPENLETKVKLLKESDKILLKPLCEEIFEVTGTNVSEEGEVYNRNKSIVVTFNNTIADENDLSDISISISGSDITDPMSYFSEPIISNRTITFVAKSNNLIPVAQNSTRTVTVTLPSSIYTVGNYSNVALENDYKFSYVIDSSTSEKAGVYFSYNEDRGTLKVDGDLPGLAEKRYNIGQTVTLTYKNTDKYYFKGWNVEVADGNPDDSILLSYPENASSFGYDSESSTATVNMIILQPTQGIRVSPKIEMIPTAKITMSSSHGRSNPVNDNVFDYKELQDYTISFEADSGFCFTQWVLEDRNAPWRNLTPYIEIKDPGLASTTFRIKNELPLPEGMKLVITPKYVERGDYLSVTPTYTSEGSYRDAPIQVMFDQNISSDSIYYTNSELADLAIQGILTNELKSTVVDGVTKYYGYETNGNTYYKNIAITNLYYNANLLQYYGAPYISNGNVLVIPTRYTIEDDGSRKIQAPLPGTRILVSISENFFYTEPTYNRSITMKSGKRWDYLVNGKTDSEPPYVNVYILNHNYENIAALNESPVGSKEKYSALWVKDDKLRFYVDVSDSGSGVGANITQKIQRVTNGYNSYDSGILPEAVVDSIPTYSEGNNNYSYGSAAVVNELDLSSYEDGIYKLSFEVPDRNGNVRNSEDVDTATSKSNYYYFLLDRIPPAVETPVITSLDEALKLEWTEDSAIDFNGRKITHYSVNDDGNKDEDTATELSINTEIDEIDSVMHKFIKDIPLSEGTRHIFKFDFMDLAGNVTSYEIAKNTLPGSVTNPTTTGSTGNKIVLNWDYPSTTGEGGEKNKTYSKARIYRTVGAIGADNENAPNISTPDPIDVDKVTGAANGSYSDENLTLGTTYNYLIYAVDNDGNVSTNPTSIITKNTQPNKITDSDGAITGVSGDKNITLTWTNPAGNVAYTDIYYGTSENFTDSGEPVQVNAVADEGSETNIAALKIGTKYYFHLYNNDGNSTSEKSLVANFKKNTLPGKMGTVNTPTLADADGNKLTITWAKPDTTAGINSTYNGAKIFYSTGTEIPTNVTPNSVTVDKNTTTKTIENLQLGTTYNFAIYTLDDEGNLSVEPSNIVTKNTKPNAILQENISRTAKDGSIDLLWVNPNGNVAGTDVYWGETPEFTDDPSNYIDVSDTSGRATIGSVDSPLKKGTKYYIHLYNKDNEAGNVKSDVVEKSANTLPGLVRNVNAVTTGDKITLSWTAPDTTGGINGTYKGATVYYTSNGTTPNKNSASVSTDTDTVDITTDVPGATYKFAVYTKDDEGNLSSSPMTIEKASKPNSITNVSFTTTGNIIKLDWQRPAGNFNKTRIVYGTDPDLLTGTTTKTVENEGLTFTTPALTFGKTYYFKLTNLDSENIESEPTVFHRNTAPLALTSSLTSTKGKYNEAVNVGWTKNASNSTTLQRVRIYYAKNTVLSSITDLNKTSVGVKSTYATYTENGSISITPSDSTMVSGYKYTIAIAAIDNEGNEGPVSSSEQYIITPKPVTSISSSSSGTTATLEWTAPENDVGITSYDVYYGQSSSSLTKATNVSTTTATIGGLSGGTTYYYRVDVISNELTTIGTPQKGGTTKPNTVQNLAVSMSGTTATVSWTIPAGSKSGFKVYYGKSDVLSEMTLGASCGNTQKTATITGLETGAQYYFRVVTYMGSWSNSSSFINSENCSISSSVDGYTKPAVPTISSITTTGTTAKINWTAPSIGSYDGYKVYYGTSESSLSLYGTNYDSTATTATISGLTAGTKYYFKVVSYIGSWISDTSNNAASTSTTYRYTTLNKATINSVTVTDSTATVNWTEPSGNYDGFKLYYGTSDDIASMTMASESFSKTTTSGTITGLTGGASYYFIVVAYTDSWIRYSSSNASISEPKSASTKVSKVTEFKYTATDTNSVTVSWTYGQGNHGKWDIYRKLSSVSDDSGNWTQQSGYWGTSSTISAKLSGLDSGTKYDFAIWIGSSSDTSWWSKGNMNDVIVIRNVYTKPDAVTPTVSSRDKNSLTLNWSAPSGNIDGYKLYYGTANNVADMNEYTGSLTAASTTATVSSLTAGTQYYFKLYTYVGAWSSYSDATVNCSTTAVSAYTVPNAPTISSVTTNSTSEITVNWSKPTGNISGYKLYYGTSSDITTMTEFTGTLTSSSTSAKVTGLTAGTYYYFRVVSYAGEWDEYNSTTTPISSYSAAYTKPNYATLTVTPASTTSVTVSWSKPAGGISGYKLYYGTSTSIGSMSSISVGSTATSTTVSSLTTGTTYYFRLVSYVGTWDSYSAANSNYYSYYTGYTKPLGVSNVTASTPSSSKNSSITINWTNPASSSYAGIKIFYGTSSSSITNVWSGTIGKTDTSATITGLSAGTQYYFKVATYTGSYTSRTAANVVASSAVSRYTGYAKPTAPSVYADDGFGHVTLKFTVPSNANRYYVNAFVDGSYASSCLYVKKLTAGSTQYLTFDIPSYKTGTSYTLGIDVSHDLNGGETMGEIATVSYSNSNGNVRIAGDSVPYSSLVNANTSSRTVTKSTSSQYYWNNKCSHSGHDSANEHSAFNGTGSVTIPVYSIGKFEVTQQLYYKIMESNPSVKHNDNTSSYPVESVSWWNAILFCNKLSTAVGLTPYYKVLVGSSWVTDWVATTTPIDWEGNSSSTGFRLPTAAEWEFAARGGNPGNSTNWWSYFSGGGKSSTELTSTSTTFSNCNTVAWNSKNSNSTTHHCADLKNANALGIYNMSGNVWEWTMTPSYNNSSYMLQKGGSWDNNTNCNVMATAADESKTDYDSKTGFRVVRNIIH